MTVWTFLVEVLGWSGVILYVIAYVLVSMGRVDGRDPSYQTLNLVGALGVAANAFYYGAYPSAVVNVIWFGIAAVTLLGVVRARRERDPAHARTGEGLAALRLLGFGGALLAVFGLALAVIAVMPRPERPIQPVFVFTQDWEPYVGRTLPGGGPLSELVRDLFRASNYEARILFTDWDDALGKVQSGVGAAAFPFIAGPSRAERVLFTDPVLDFEYVLFYRRGLTAPTGERNEDAVRAWLDLKEGRPTHDAGAWDGTAWRLAAVAGYALWPALEDVASVDVEFDTPAQAFRALARGDVELVVEGRLVGRNTIEDPASGVAASEILAVPTGDPRSASEEPLHLVTSPTPAGRALRDQLNARIAEFRERGELGELRARFDALGRVEVAMQSVTDAVGRQGMETTRHLLPAGTRALVLEWPPRYRDDVVDPAGPPPGDQTGAGLALVRILNGPLRGWEVHVEPEMLVIVSPERPQ